MTSQGLVAARILTAARAILIVGVPGAGKSTMARTLAPLLDLTYIDIDALKHGPSWSDRAELADDVERLTRGRAWIADSAAYPVVADMLWSRARVVIILDLPRRVVLTRLLQRTACRQARRQVLTHGNRESLRRVFSRQHPIAKVLTTYASRRAELMDRARSYSGDLIHITTVRDAAALTAAAGSAQRK